MTPEFSVILPTGGRPSDGRPTDGRPDKLLKCLDALSRQKLPHHQFEIIVVDDADDRTTEATVRNFTQVFGIEARYLSQPRRTGLAAARNRGWQAARGKILAFTDDDCQPQPDWLTSALPCFKRGAQVVSGHLRIPLTTRPSTYDHGPLYTESAHFTSANLFCLRSAVHRAGGFSEDFTLASHEDSDLQFKMIRKGVPISKCPEAVVLHPIEPPQSLLAEQRLKSYDALLYKRHPDLFRQRMPQQRRQLLQYTGAILSLTVAFSAVLTGHTTLALFAVGIWGFLIADLFHKNLPSGPLTVDGLKQALTMATAAPVLSIFWRLHGAVKYRVLYL